VLFEGFAGKRGKNPEMRRNNMKSFLFLSVRDVLLRASLIKRGAEFMSGPVYPLPEIEDILLDNPGWRDEAIDTPSVSRLTGGPVCTLAHFNCRGGGPPFLKLGTAVRCRRRTVLRWSADGKHGM
jgi:hypothetical protein